MAAKPVCAIVGAGPLNGLSLAKLFSSHGYSIALLSRNQAALSSFVDEVKASGGVAKAFVSDAGSEQSIVDGHKRVRDELGDPEVLIYNAAVLKPGLPSAVSFDRLVDEFRVNVAGAAKWSSLVSPSMAANKKGTIIFTGGALSKFPNKQYASLALGKAALLSLGSSFAQELGPQGIQVGSVTIYGIVKKGSMYDPEEIAKSFWTIHSQPKEKRQFMDIDFKAKAKV